MQEDTLKEIINDAHNLAMAHVDPGHLRFGIEGIALRLEELQRNTSAANNPVQTHTHTTDKEKPMMTLQEKNEVLGNALDDIKHLVTERCGGHPDNIEAQYDCNKAAFDQIAKILADAMRLDVFGDEPPLTGFAKFLSLPELGIQFRRYRSANMTKLIATWRDDANAHVYEISVQRDGDSPNCGWRATATNDGHVVFQLRTKNRSNCEHFAFSAMKRYLKRGHRRTYRTIAKAKEEK